MGESGAAVPTEGVGDGDGAVVGRNQLRALIDLHYEFVWHSLRRLGLPPADVDDGVQRVFMVLSRRYTEIRPGLARPFLFQTAIRVAADHRRTIRRRREAPPLEPDAVTDPAPFPDELADLRRARVRLDTILDELPLDLRAVFTLFELDQMTLTEIAELLDVPRGTVASRLRRAREIFRERARAFPGGSEGGTP